MTFDRSEINLPDSYLRAALSSTLKSLPFLSRLYVHILCRSDLCSYRTAWNCVSVCRSTRGAQHGLRLTAVAGLSSNVRHSTIFCEIEYLHVITEGDHIKITASKYPFPTVCAQSQSVDWFHSISRTLKWNERERQKSFVVVEEDPMKKQRRRRSSSTSTASAGNMSGKGDVSDEEDDSDDDEDEDEEEEEEEEKFDIDDLSSSESPKSATSKASADYAHEQGIVDSSVSREKALEVAGGTHQRQAEAAARALAEGSPWLKYNGKSSPRSGVETPDRFAGPHPHPPKLSPRHVQFISPELSSGSSSTSLAPPPAMERDTTVTTHGEVHAPRPARLAQGERERELTGGEVERETLKTPTLTEEARRRRSRDRSAHRERTPFQAYDANEAHSRRAFAVWGQDESDSATSDSEP